MKITFLGTGGGRVNLIGQYLHTGGFRIDSKFVNIHIDPGPGALVYSLKDKLDPKKVDCIIVTHIHIDHSNDTAVLVEAMTGYGFKKRGILIGSSCLIEGKDNINSKRKVDGCERVIGSYHLSKPKEVYAVYGEVKKTFNINKDGEESKSFEIEFIKVKHDEPSTFGFKIKLEDKVIGYTSDTNYFDELPEKLKGCDYLIINCLKPRKDKIPDHLSLLDVEKLLKISKPKTAFITHRGMKLQHYGDKRTKKEIEEITGINTIVPKDNESFEL